MVVSDGGTAPVRVLIDARLPGNGSAGGIELAVKSLIRALGQSGRPDVHVAVWAQTGCAGWLADAVQPSQQLVLDSSARGNQLRCPLSRLIDRIYGTIEYRHRERIRRFLRRPPPFGLEPLVFPRGVEADVVHVPFQRFGVTPVPAIFEPWDLQHVHLPGLLAPEIAHSRRIVYAAAARQAAAVVAHSRWARHDFITHLPIEPGRVYTIPVGAGTEGYPQPTPAKLADVKNRFGLPDAFALYPAQPWPHKNHARLFDAWAEVVSCCDEPPHLVCTGYENPHFWPALRRRIRALGLDRFVHFLGFLPDHRDVQALYALAEFLIFPSLFEGWGLPVMEAFQHYLPVACSAITNLPELVGDAALLFDPTSKRGIVDAVLAMHTRPALRQRLAEHGWRRKDLYTWRSAAENYGVLYWYLAGRDLTTADRRVIEEMTEGEAIPGV